MKRRLYNWAFHWLYPRWRKLQTADTLLSLRDDRALSWDIQLAIARENEIKR